MLALAGLSLMDLLSEPTREWLGRIGTRRSYGDGEMVHRRGDPDPSMCVVIGGRVRLTRLQANGTQIFVSSVQPGQHFGDVLFHGRRRRTHDAWAVGDVVIDHYDEAAYQQLLANHEVLLALHRVTAARLSGSMSMAEDLRALPREVHLAKILLALRPDAGGMIACVQEDLAGLLGTSVMTLSKGLAQLKREGLIETGYRSLRITDRARLRAWLAAHSPE